MAKLKEKIQQFTLPIWERIIKEQGDPIKRTN
ncbi:MAG: hypothetical protein KatS3mg129_0484 [Leptospiraceae bacterium]|nr:MAG: hypothetical protein KatS3mg129_0484 [Leptospiraceae bacterium]